MEFFAGAAGRVDFLGCLAERRRLGVDAAGAQVDRRDLEPEGRFDQLLGAFGALGRLRMHAVEHDVSRRVACHAEQIAHACKRFKVEDLGPDRDQHQVGRARGLDGGAVGAAGRVDEDQVDAMVLDGLQGGLEPADLRGHHHWVLGLAPVLPVRGIRLRIQVNDGHGAPSARSLDSQAERHRRLAGAALLTNDGDFEQVNTSTCLHVYCATC